MNKSKKLVFFGNERLATGVSTTVPTLSNLIKHGYEIAAVVSHYSRGQSRNARDLEIAAVAKKNAIPLLLPENLAEVSGELASFGADAGVLVAYGKIVPQAVIDIFPRGIINIHPSLLPKYRGPTPVEAAILNGDEKTGVSLMALAARMDAGPIYTQQEISLGGAETKQQLAEKLLKAGSELLIEKLPEIISGNLEPQQQVEAAATYTNLLTKSQGMTDFNEPAAVIERKIRAYSVFPKTKAGVNNIDVVITKSRLADNQDDGKLVVKCNPGYLEILELTAPSGRAISGSDFLRGYSKT